MSRTVFFKYLLVATWMVLIFAFSSQGHEVSSGQSGEIVHLISKSLHVSLSEFVVRKGAHIFLYFVLGMLVSNLLWSYDKTTRWRLGVAVLVVGLYAASDELHQAFIPGRTAMATDVLIDTTAGAIGVLAYYFSHKRRGPSGPRVHP